MDKGLIARIYEEPKIKHQSINNPILKWANELNRESSKEYMKK
jgi:hypothetical protein